jgi:pantoate--beta-alanine ligase
VIITDTISGLRQYVAALRSQGKRVAFVPTLGNLHAGHLALVQEARELADAVVVSIYVNPLQFGPSEDLAAYPRTPEQDRAALERERADLLFMPGDREMYPPGVDAMTRVEVPVLSSILCGASRPGHFRGVATVVNRLLNLVGPDVAVFGKKDYQQLLVIRRMVSDLGMPVEIIGVETVRDPDGLALSSRNGYLTIDERRVAPRLYTALRTLREQTLQAGRMDTAFVQQAIDGLAANGFRVDYLSVRRQADLAEPQAGDCHLVILAAVWLGRTRLIDNMEIELPVPV